MENPSSLFSRIADIVEENHFDSGFLANAWPRLRARHEGLFADAGSPSEREAVVAALLEAIGVSHSVLITPALREKIEGLTADPRRNRPTTERIGETLVVNLRSFKGRTTTCADLRAIAEEAGDATNVVIDLRVNDGGSGCVVAHTARLFLPGNLPVLRVIDRAGARRREPHVLFPFPEATDPDHELELAAIREHHLVEYRTDHETLGRFRGNVVVLLGESCYSCGEVFAQALKEYGRATMVGGASAGAVVAADEHDLDDGYGLMFPFAEMRSGKGYRLEGRGVTPHLRMALAELSYGEILNRLSSLHLLASGESGESRAEAGP